MKSFAASLRGLPRPARWTVFGAAAAGVLGAIAGLAIGLFGYPPTAPFAAAEIGLPAVIAGGVAGLAARVIATAVGHIRRDRTHIL